MSISPPFALDRDLANQLKAMNCAFNVAVSVNYGPLLHVGYPFSHSSASLLKTVRAFYPDAAYAPTDADDCLSFALEGDSCS